MECNVAVSSGHILHTPTLRGDGLSTSQSATNLTSSRAAGSASASARPTGGSTIGPKLRRRCKSPLPRPAGVQNALGLGAPPSMPPDGARNNFVQDHSEGERISRRAPRRAGRRPFTVALCNANGWGGLRTFLGEGAAGSCIVASQEVRPRLDERLQAEE
eukprot:307758-Pyramimonas_sp.AAC.1